jgi:hypothetical protein
MMFNLRKKPNFLVRSKIQVTVDRFTSHPVVASALTSVLYMFGSFYSSVVGCISDRSFLCSILLGCVVFGLVSLSVLKYLSVYLVVSISLILVFEDRVFSGNLGLNQVEGCTLCYCFEMRRRSLFNIL